MRSSVLKSALLTLSLSVLLGLTGCPQKSEPSAPTQPAAPTPAEAAAPDTPATGAAAAAPTEAKPASTPTEAELPAANAEEAQPTATITAERRETLGKAYREIYCAQRSGETEKLLEIYTRYGFAKPEAWTKTWTEAAKDSAWVAKIVQDAIRACP